MERPMSMPGRAYGYQNAELSHSNAYLRGHFERAITGRAWPARARALDFGCGNGALTAWLASKGFSAAGVDISESGIAIAKSAYPEIEFSNDVSARGLAALGPFDLVMCVEVIAHCYDPARELKAIFDCLKPGGALILATPYHGYLKDLALAVTGRLQRHLDTNWAGAYMHFFTIDAITKLLRDAGFEIVEIARAGRVPALAKSMILTCARP